MKPNTVIIKQFYKAIKIKQFQKRKEAFALQWDNLMAEK